jgi:hypothetical protein
VSRVEGEVGTATGEGSESSESRRGGVVGKAGVKETRESHKREGDKGVDSPVLLHGHQRDREGDR